MYTLDFLISALFQTRALPNYFQSIGVAKKW